MFLSKGEGFTSQEVQRLTGLTNRHLQYWDEQGVFPPSVNRPKDRAKGRGRRRIYSALDVVVLQAVSVLKRKGMSFQKIRKTLEYLRKEFGIEQPFHDALNGQKRISLLTDGVKSFYLCQSDREILDILKSQGQYMLLPLSDLAKDLKERLREIEKERRESEKRRSAA